MLGLNLPSGKASANVASAMRINSAHKSVQAVIKSFEDSQREWSDADGVVNTKDVALLRLEFPELATKNNFFTFTLQFPSKTVQAIAEEFYLMGLTQDLPGKTTKLAKQILEVTEFETLEEFASNYRLSRTASKLYSILRENGVEYDLSNLAKSLTSKELDVQTYQNAKSGEFTIASVSYKPTKATNSRRPKAKSQDLLGW
jgi:hypothetical protein